MKKLMGVLFLLSATLLGKERIDLITHFDMVWFPVDYTLFEEADIEISVIWSKDYQCRNDDDLKKIFVMNPIVDLSCLAKLPKEKLVLFNWEPIPVPDWYFDAFSKVYTWNDTLVDNKKFFKTYYPFWMPMRQNLRPFDQRKFCTMVASNWTKARLEMLSFFACKGSGELEFYGHKAPYKTPMYKGQIPGWDHGEPKLDVLENYKFCICFENTAGLMGYVTEKIFPCFVAGSLPVYLGAANIEEFIPKNCFIDFRDFKNKEEMYQFLKHMSEEQYLKYLENIQAFLESDASKVFTPENVGKIFYHAAQ